VGLILAVDRLPARDVRLPVTPSPRSTGRCFGTPATGPDTRTPRRLGELQSRIHAAPLSQCHCRAPPPSEIARHLNLDVEIILEALAAQDAAHTASLDEPGWHYEGGGSADGVGSPPRLSTTPADRMPAFATVDWDRALG
jgi:hypothetical protein